MCGSLAWTSGPRRYHPPRQASRKDSWVWGGNGGFRFGGAVWGVCGRGTAAHPHLRAQEPWPGSSSRQPRTNPRDRVGRAGARRAGAQGRALGSPDTPPPRARRSKSSVRDGKERTRPAVRWEGKAWKPGWARGGSAVGALRDRDEGAVPSVRGRGVGRRCYRRSSRGSPRAARPHNPRRTPASTAPWERRPASFFVSTSEDLATVGRQIPRAQAGWRCGSRGVCARLPPSCSPAGPPAFLGHG